MRCIAILLAALMLASGVCFGGSLSAGAGLAYYKASAESAPFIGVDVGQLAFDWARDGEINKTTAGVCLRLKTLPQSLGCVSALGGLGVDWIDFNEWLPSAVYGLRLDNAYAGFGLKMEWLREKPGGAFAPEDRYSIGLYLSPKAVKK